MAADAGIRRGSAERGAARSRPVLLATLGVPFDLAAAEVAVDSAVETGLPLIIANVVELAPLPLSLMLGHDQIDTPEDAEAFREREPGLLVFGPDRERIGRRRYGKAAKAVRERAACLVWLA